MSVRRIPLLLALTAAGMAAAAGPVAGETAPAAAPPAGEAELPGPPTLQRTWTARVLFPVVGRRAPGGATLMRLRHYTEWSLGPSAYMVTGATIVNGKRWIRIQVPKRPNGTQAWVPRSAVDLRTTRTWIRISNRARTLSVFQDGRRVKRFLVGVGTGGTPTPRGLFAILDPVAVGGHQLGPYILVLTAHSTVFRTFMGGDGIVGIHGWPSSSIQGKAVSNGCIRMSRSDVRALARYAKPGVPVEILP